MREGGEAKKGGREGGRKGHSLPLQLPFYIYRLCAFVK